MPMRKQKGIRSAKERRIVEVLWRDSMSGRGWKGQGEAHELFETDAIIHSVGYLFRDDRGKIALVGCIDHQDGDEFQGSGGPSVNRYHEIPRAMVKSIRYLK